MDRPPHRFWRLFVPPPPSQSTHRPPTPKTPTKHHSYTTPTARPASTPRRARAAGGEWGQRTCLIPSLAVGGGWAGRRGGLGAGEGRGAPGAPRICFCRWVGGWVGRWVGGWWDQNHVGRYVCMCIFIEVQQLERNQGWPLTLTHTWRHAPTHQQQNNNGRWS